MNAGKSVGIIEAEKERVTFIGEKSKAENYTKGILLDLPGHTRPLTFLHQNIGAESRITPHPSSAPFITFHRPETLAIVVPLQSEVPRDLPGSSPAAEVIATFLGVLKLLPLPDTMVRWPFQVPGITNLEQSMALEHPLILSEATAAWCPTIMAVR